MSSCQFSRWRISAVVDYRGPMTGSLKSTCATSSRSSIRTIDLNCLVFDQSLIRHFGDRKTDSQSNRPTNIHRKRRKNRWTVPMH